MLFDWRKDPPSFTDNESYSPFRRRRCPCCGFEGRPRMTWPYRACLIGALLVLVPLVWFVPWSWKIRHFSRGAGREEILLLLGYAVYALAYNRDAYRCRRCDGILW